MSIEAFEQRKREREIFREVARGEREIASGSGFSLEEVVADAAKALTRRHR